jgi:hypothetical protein
MLSLPVGANFGIFNELDHSASVMIVTLPCDAGYSTLLWAESIFLYESEVQNAKG